MQNKLAFKSLLLLLVIYIAFIALGLPDALLGSAWSLVRLDLNTSLGSLGILTVLIYIMSIISTYNAPRLLRLFQTKWITGVSILFTGLALIFISRVDQFYQMLFFALPLGVGAGAIDVSLNHYLATYYKASHMSFLHAFYGIGVTLGPSVMAYTLQSENWRLGYMIVGGLLLGIAVLVFISFPLWHKEMKDEATHEHIAIKTILKVKGAKMSLSLFLLYVHIESLLGVWVSSFMYLEKGVSLSFAALFVSFYYIGLTIGRLMSGILTHYIRPKTVVMMGLLAMVIGSSMLFLSNNDVILAISIFLIGIGSGPIYPNLMYINNDYFKQNQLSKIISLQMVIGYMGFGILTPLTGVFFDAVSIAYFPIFIGV